jgi:2-dehydro-3-deoxyphosphogluconate aldolase/(4S)-4-hydroxy-2-oxoglutarate aldolase
MSRWSDAVAECPVIAVVRHEDDAVAEQIARAAAAGGIRLLEITFTVPSAAALIARLRRDLPDTVIGAGTVLTAAQVAEAADAGAEFMVSPITDREVISAASDRAVPFLAGAATPTEVASAASAGAAAVKIFPASSLGIAFVSAVKDVLPDIALMPTGGIRPADIASWLTAGATAVGLAGALTSAWKTGGADAVREEARLAVTEISQLRSTP